MKNSFKLLSRHDARDTFTGRLFRWIFYAIAFAFLIWPAVLIVAIGAGLILAALAIVVALSIVLLPVAILLRVLRLV